MTRAILATELKPGDIIKFNVSLALVLTECTIKNEFVEFKLLLDNKIKTQTVWKDVDLVNVYDPALVDLWQ